MLLFHLVTKKGAKANQLFVQTMEEVVIRSYRADDFDQMINVFVEGHMDNSSDYGIREAGAQHYIERSIKDDLRQIEDVYFKKGGHFWVAVTKNEDSQILGMVGLEHLNSEEGELRRMSVARK